MKTEAEQVEAMVNREIVRQGLRRLHEVLDGVCKRSKGELRTEVNATTVDGGFPAFDVWVTFWPETAPKGRCLSQRTIEAGADARLMNTIGLDILQEWMEASGANPADIEGTAEYYGRMAEEALAEDDIEDQAP